MKCVFAAIFAALALSGCAGSPVQPETRIEYVAPSALGCGDGASCPQANAPQAKRHGPPGMPGPEELPLSELDEFEQELSQGCSDLLKLTIQTYKDDPTGSFMYDPCDVKFVMVRMDPKIMNHPLFVRLHLERAVGQRESDRMYILHHKEMPLGRVGAFLLWCILRKDVLELPHAPG